MLVLEIVFIIIVLNLLLCSTYCLYRKRRSTLPLMKEMMGSQDSRRIEDSEQRLSSAVKKSEGIKLKIIKKYIFVMESFMRINLLFTAYIPSHFIRNFLYRFIYQMDFEKKAVIYYGAEIRSPWNIHIGKGSIVGDKAILDGREGIWIDENVNLSTGVSIYTLQHDMQSSTFMTEGGPVIVGRRAWLSCNTVILPNTQIREGTVVAAGAVLTKNTEPYHFYGGVPAKCIGVRNSDLTYQFDGKHFHFL